MMNTKILTGLLLTLAFSSWAQQELNSTFPVKWKTDIGITTYRTNIVEHKGLIYIGSNGIDREAKIDSKDGVYAIDPKNGQIVHHYKIPFAGDNDVTGIALSEDKLFFGSDNYYFFCYDIKTHKELWKYPLPYDVESSPVIADFNGDKVNDVAFNVQYSGFYALNGINGELLWVSAHINSHDGNVSPVLLDLNKDGVMDIITSGRGEPNSNEIDGFKMAHYGDYHFALNGKNGEILWSIPTGAGVHASPFVYKSPKGIEIYLIDSYGELNVVDESGKILKGGYVGYGVFSSPVVTNDHHLVIGQFSFNIKHENFIRENEDSPYYLSNTVASQSAGINGTISATSMIADVLNLGKPQIVGVDEEGILFISTTDGKVIHKYKIPKGAEASLFIKDIDNDGKLEILLASLDGKLYCYGTKSSGKIEFGQFKN